MFSHLADRISEHPKQALLVAAGIVVIVAQLVSMAAVVKGQVQRAEVRETVRESTRVATLDCLDSNPSMTVRACAARAALDVADSAPGRFDDGYAAAAAVAVAPRSAIVPVNFYAVR